MQYLTSQFDYLFLLNIPIPISLHNGDILNLRTPSINDYYIQTDYRRLETLFMTSLLDMQLNPLEYGFVADSYLELILGTKMRDEANTIFELLESIAGVEISKESITCNGVPLREEDVLELRYAYLLATGKIDINGDSRGSGADEDEMSKKMRESEEKIKALRGTTGEGEKATFKEMLILILYELDKSPKDLRELNFFGIYELYNTASAVTYDKISKIAAGNGLLGEKTPYKSILSK